MILRIFLGLCIISFGIGATIGLGHLISIVFKLFGRPWDEVYDSRTERLATRFMVAFFTVFGLMLGAALAYHAGTWVVYIWTGRQ